MTPIVSIIIPNYNHARYLPQRIESVLNQTYHNTEVIIMDDCSPDFSREVIAEYAAKDSRIRVVLNEQNSGSTFKQWNKGIALATGKYIWLAESDDYADEKFLETLVGHLEADEAIGLAYCASWSVDENSLIIGNWNTFYTDLDPVLWTKDFSMNGQHLLSEFMSIRNVIPNASAVVIRREVLLKIGPADETFRLNGDWIFWVKILTISKIAYSAQSLNYFRQHTNNVRSNTLKNGTALLELTRMAGIFSTFATLEQRFFDRMFDKLFNVWFTTTLEHNITLAKHWQIIRNLKAADRNFYSRFSRLFIHSLFSNKMSGLRQVLGDGILYRITKNRKLPINAL